MTPARSSEARIADVRRLVTAARALAEGARFANANAPLETAPLRDAIAASTGLSVEGVERALSRHLETDATDDEIARLVAQAEQVECVTVILSANVFVGALRAIAIARAAAPRIVVRPSRRDPAFARALVVEARDPAIVLDETLRIEDVSAGELHVYGHDATIADIRARAKVRVRGHGSGMGVAVVNGDPIAAARALADDVVAFDQRGCLSPRVVLVNDGEAFAELLHSELERLGLEVPRGPLPADVRAESDRYIATMTYACRALVGTGHVIGVAPVGAPLVASPAYRHVHVATVSSRVEAETLLAPVRRAIVAVGADGQRPSWTPPWARVSALGRMQRPPLDGPVDLRSTE